MKTHEGFHMANRDRDALRAVPDAPRRVIAIIRVSDEGGRGEQLLSPDLQLAAIERDAPRRRWKIVDVVRAIDKSGSQRRSAWWPTLDAAIARVESGDVDGIVAWKYSRFARNRLRWAIAVDRIESAGGVLESATEQLDATTSAGRFQRGVLAEVNAFQADIIGESWVETHEDRLARGLPINGRPRFGYVYSREDGFVPDPTSGPVLAEAYHRYVAGESLYSLVTWIRTTGTRPVNYGIASKGEWSDTTLRRVLDSGFGAGLLNKHNPDCRRKHQATGKCRDRIFMPGAHEPVIDAATWERYRAARAERGRPQVARAQRSPHLLVGLAWCVKALDDGTPCGGRMTYRVGGREADTKIYCLNSQAKRSHSGGSIAAWIVEQKVFEWMRDLAEDVEAAVARAAAEEADRSKELTVIDGQLAAAIANRSRQTRRYVADLIPEEEWPAIKAELEDAVTRLQRKKDRLESASTELPEVIAAAALEDWDTWSLERQRAVLQSLIERVEVTPGRLEKVVGARNGGSGGLVRIVPRER